MAIVIWLVCICTKPPKCKGGKKGSGSDTEGSHGSGGGGHSDQESSGKKKKSKDNDCASPCESDSDECSEKNCCQLVRRLEKRVRKDENKTKSDIQQLLIQIDEVDKKRTTLLNTWSINFDGRQSSPGTINNEPLLFAAATPQGNTIISDSQTAAASVQQAPFDGIIEAFTVQSSTALSAGTVSLVININGIPTTLSAQYTTSTPSGFVTQFPVSDIVFHENDFIGVSLSSSGAIATNPPAIYTAQIWVRFTS